MRIAFAGKGGSGKTTLAAAFTRYLAADGAEVVALDSDVNAHLAQALGLPSATATSGPLPPTLGSSFEAIAEYFEGHRPAFRLLAADHIPHIGTIPPGGESRWVIPGPDDEFLSRWARTDPDLPGVYLVSTGGHEQQDVGDSCYHVRLNAAEMLVHRLLDYQSDHWLVADVTAGVDVVGTSLLIGYDLYALVVEPTPASVDVVRNFLAITQNSDYSVPCVVVPNKITDRHDLEFLARHLPHNLQVTDPVMWDKKIRDGQPFALPATTALWTQLHHHTLKHPRDWDRYATDLQQMFTHRCRSWWNSFDGRDLLGLVDHDFCYPSAPELR